MNDAPLFPDAAPAPQPPIPGETTIVIVGGGASGTLTAVQLMRRSAPGLRVILVERHGEPGPGIPYRTANEHHRLNVPAAQMVALPDRPEDFLWWARRRLPRAEAHDYLPRGAFGDYLRDLLARSREEASGRVVFEHVRAEAVACDGEEVRLDDGRRLRADRVVLATGNGSPVDPPELDRTLADDARYVRDPWREGALDAVSGLESVLLLGSGLTMVDVALSLAGRRGPTMHALSRHGLLPRVHDHAPVARPRPIALPEERCTLTELTSRLLTEVTIGGDKGVDWRTVLDSLRPVTNEIWQSLDRRDQRLFLADLSRMWGVHRHRMAPEVSHQVRRVMRMGQLSVRAGMIARIEPRAGRIAVEMIPRGHDEGEGLVELMVDGVVNCTGPVWDPRVLDAPLVRDLADRGLLRSDALGVGFDVDPDGALIGLDALPSRRLFAIGPVRSGVLLETTAVPEIGQQAERLADTLLGDLVGSIGDRTTVAAG